MEDFFACAALFVDKTGVYSEVPWVDVYDIDRDARTYEGPYPVVAHPPCQKWGALAKVNFARYGGEHNRPGEDGGCFESALKSVRTFGGVLEHPKKSTAFDRFGITKPSARGWVPVKDGYGGWVCEVWQSAYGHRANKATWLYYCGLRPPFSLIWDRPKGTHQVGWTDQRGKGRNKPTLSKREANSTPIKFRDTLLALAMWSTTEHY